MIITILLSFFTSESTNIIFLLSTENFQFRTLVFSKIVGNIFVIHIEYQAKILCFVCVCVFFLLRLNSKLQAFMHHFLFFTTFALVGCTTRNGSNQGNFSINLFIVLYYIQKKSVLSSTVFQNHARTRMENKILYGKAEAQITDFVYQQNHLNASVIFLGMTSNFLPLYYGFD